MFETLKQMKSDKKQVFADIVYFDLIYPSEKKRENSNRGQKMSAKICQKFLYCELTLAGSPIPPRHHLSNQDILGSMPWYPKVSTKLR